MKYILTCDSLEFEGKTLYRIQAIKDFNNVKKGDIGGYVESTDNLSQHGNCWIYNDAKAMGSSMVLDNASLEGRSVMKDHSTLAGNSRCSGATKLMQGAWIGENAWLLDSYIADCPQIEGNSRIHNSTIVGNAYVTGNTYILDSTVKGYSVISGNACVFNKQLEDDTSFNFITDRDEMFKPTEETDKRALKSLFKNDISKALSNRGKSYGEDI